MSSFFTTGTSNYSVLRMSVTSAPLSNNKLPAGILVRLPRSVPRQRKKMNRFGQKTTPGGTPYTLLPTATQHDGLIMAVIHLKRLLVAASIGELLVWSNSTEYQILSSNFSAWTIPSSLSSPLPCISPQ